MPTTPEGVDVFLAAKALYGPGKAANAGGVAVSGLEMTQNAGVVRWPREEVDMRLQQIMKSIHENCVRYGSADGFVNYVRGANVAGFVKVADAMLAQGCV
jgi:glutamate dehydrogenase (NADP+)